MNQKHQDEGIANVAKGQKTQSTKDALLGEALKIIEEDGLENLSLRNVARRLGISHQAPYKHFSSRQHIIDELVAQLHDEFTETLEKRPIVDELSIDLGNIGVKYLEYAFAHPLKYELLFARFFPSETTDPGAVTKARRAFDLLQSRLEEIDTKPTRHGSPSARMDAFFIWATLHGVVSILHSNAIETLRIDEEEKALLQQHMFDRIGIALDLS